MQGGHFVDKKILIGLGFGLILIVLGIITATIGGNSTSSTASGEESPDSMNVENLTSVRACELLTMDEAKKLLGSNATESSNASMITNEDISVDTCSYTNNGTTADTIRIITVMARSALTKVGLDNNLGAFEKNGTANPKGAIAVDGFGDHAYWDPMTYQLAILDGNTWLSIVYGGTDPTKNTLEDAKKAASLVMN